MMHRRVFLGALWLSFAGAAETMAQLPAEDSAASPHPGLEAALEHLNARRWRDLSSMVAALPAQSGRVLIGDLGATAPLSADYGALPQLAMGHTILAGLHVGWAWRYRGHGVGSTVTAAALEGFLRHLNVAKTHFGEAVSRDPHDGAAHAIGFAIHKGLSEKISLYAGLRGYLMAARRPVGGLSAFVDAISRKWLGSEEEALGFARQVSMLDLPASAGVIADAHYVCWGARVMDSVARGEAAESFASYLARPAVHAEILASDEAFRSVGPDPDQFANWHANNRLSFALITLNEGDRARPHLVNMGDHIGGPWSDLADPLRALTIIRRGLGLEAA